MGVPDVQDDKAEDILMKNRMSNKALSNNNLHKNVTDLDFEKVSSELIKAESGQAEHLLALSSLDKFIFKIHIPAYFVFKSPAKHTFEEVTSSLKKSLAKALDLFYPFAGRMKENPETLEWEVHCNNAGAIFKVVQVDMNLEDVPFDDLNFVVKKLAKNIIPAVEDGVPILVIQATRFKCGAIALGCSFDHQVGDAHAVGKFMHCWTQLAAGVDEERIKFRASFDRSIVIPKLEDAGWSGPAPSAVAGTRKATTTVKPKVPSHTSGPSIIQGFLFNNSSLATLKSMAPGYTSFEVATAFMWRHITRATSPICDSLSGAISPIFDTLAKMALLIDYRGRTRSPRVPDEYCGNAALSVALILPLGVVVDGPLDLLAHAVHEAIGRADTGYYHSFFRYAGQGPPKGETALAVSSCSRMPLYDTDFGWGHPVFATICLPPSQYVPEFCGFVPSPNGEGFVAYLQLPIETVNCIQQDKDFGIFVSPFSFSSKDGVE